MKSGDKKTLKRFISKMASKSILMTDDPNEKLDNVVITSNQMTIKMSYHSLERRSGMCNYMKRIKGDLDDKYEYVEFTYQMWLDRIIEPIIMKRLKLKS